MALEDETEVLVLHELRHLFGDLRPQMRIRDSLDEVVYVGHELHRTGAADGGHSRLPQRQVGGARRKEFVELDIENLGDREERHQARIGGGVWSRLAFLELLERISAEIRFVGDPILAVSACHAMPLDVGSDLANVRTPIGVRGRDAAHPFRLAARPPREGLIGMAISRSWASHWSTWTPSGWSFAMPS